LGGKPASEYLVKNDSTAQRTFSDLKYVDKASTQTITGNKTFSGNKTVFGTTTNDSVAVRGRLNVNNKFTVGNSLSYMKYEPFDNYSFKLRIYDNFDAMDWYGFTIDYPGFTLAKLKIMIAPSSNPGILSMNGSSVNASDGNWVIQHPYSLYSVNGFRTDGDIIGGEYSKIFLTDTVFVKTVKIDSAYSFPTADGTNGQVLKTNGSGILTWANVLSSTGVGSFNPDYAYLDTTITGEATLTDEVKDSIRQAMDLYRGVNSWFDYSASNVLRLGKSYNDKRFNNGAYSDVWNIDYVVPPYNLSSSWLYPIEHRTDYYNDTLKTTSSVFNLFNIDGTGTPIWSGSSIVIGGNHTNINFGDLPDSVGLSNSYAFGNRVQIGEDNKTEVASRFPMPFRMYTGDVVSGGTYTYPSFIFYYSNLANVSADSKYHFYGEGNYPSYFGGNVEIDGSLIIDGDTVTTTSAIVGTTETLDSIIIAYWNNELGGTGDTTGLWNNVYSIVDGLGDGIIGTTATLDSIIADYWNDNLGSGTWDSTYAYQRITALESTVTSLQNSINNILAALDTCGCSASTADNTPPLAPTSYTAIGGTSQTQYVTTWTDPIASDLDSIRWYEGSSNDTTSMTWITSIPAGTETYTRTGRTANTTYWSAVKAVDDSGNVSYFSNIDSATTQSVAGAIPVIESFTSDSVAGAQRIVLSKPSGVQADDLLLIVVASDDPNDTQQWNNTTNKPTGFTWASTTISGVTGTGRNDCQTHIAVFWKIATGSETDTIGIPSVGTNNDQVGYYLRISGALTSNPLDVWDSPLDSTLYQSVDTIQIHSQTTNYDNELALVVCANDGGNYGLTVETAGWSAVSDNWVDDSEYGLHLIIGEKEMPTAGATGQCIIKNATKTPNGSKVGMILTIRSE
ncbi:MAG: hypothetical protein RBR74_10485, partial [Ignavibacteriaceae bacterium]|nr:hypothetical protein [Ignavibacteriaceae bacterium]